MKILAVLLLLVCGGCSFTLTGSTRWADSEPAEQVDEGAYSDKQVAASARSLAAELHQAPQDLVAVSAILAKYGIKVGGGAPE